MDYNDCIFMALQAQNNNGGERHIFFSFVLFNGKIVC